LQFVRLLARGHPACTAIAIPRLMAQSVVFFHRTRPLHQRNESLDDAPHVRPRLHHDDKFGMTEPYRKRLRPKNQKFFQRECNGNASRSLADILHLFLMDTRNFSSLDRVVGDERR